MNNINLKAFNISEIENVSPDIRILNPKDFKKETKYTISDHLQMRVETGSENLYLDLTIYPFDGYTPQILRICTKDDHRGLKDLMKYIIQ